MYANLKTLKTFNLSVYEIFNFRFSLFLFNVSYSFLFIDEDLFLWIALFLSITNLVPYIGPYIGGIPVVIYEYIADPQMGYVAFIAVIVLQYLESSYLQPYLFSKCIRLHPIALFIALTFFGDLFGIVGMIFSPLLLSYSLLLLELLKNLNVFTKVKQIVSKE